MSVHIPDMLAYINEGSLPGAFLDERREFRYNTLVYNNSRGSKNLWTVSVRLLRDDKFMPILDKYLTQPVPALDNFKAEISVETLQQGGKVREVVPTYVSTGKNLGKKNATNPITQALRDALGMYNKQVKRHDISEIVPAGDEAATSEAKETKDAPDDEPDDEPDDAARLDEGATLEDDPTADAPADQKSDDLMPPPMLVKKIGETVKATLSKKDFEDGCTVQIKYNGIRSVGFFRASGEFTRYSRTGSLLPRQASIDDQFTELKRFLPAITPGSYGLGSWTTQKVLAAYGALSGFPHEGYPRPYIDGELYRHGVSLNNIVGQARRSKNEGELEYRIYDVFFPYAKEAGDDMPWRHRKAYIKAFAAAIADSPHSHIEIVPMWEKVKSLEEVEALAKRFVKEGYEGAIVRKDSAGYEYGFSGRHSANLVKVKPKYDAEFKVIGYTQGEKGKDVGAVIWVCQVPKPIIKSDDKFTVVPRGISLKMRKRLYHCLGQKVENSEGKMVTRFERDVKGLLLTVEYAELSTKTGKPQQAKAVAFRTYEGTVDSAGQPVVDPIKALFEECAD